MEEKKGKEGKSSEKKRKRGVCGIWFFTSSQPFRPYQGKGREEEKQVQIRKEHIQREGQEGRKVAEENNSEG